MIAVELNSYGSCSVIAVTPLQELPLKKGDGFCIRTFPYLELLLVVLLGYAIVLVWIKFLVSVLPLPFLCLFHYTHLSSPLFSAYWLICVSLQEEKEVMHCLLTGILMCVHSGSSTQDC